MHLAGEGIILEIFETADLKRWGKRSKQNEVKKKKTNLHLNGHEGMGFMGKRFRVKIRERLGLIFDIMPPQPLL